MFFSLFESMKCLGKIPPEEWDEEAHSQKELEKTGAKLGEDLYRRGGSWTVNQFLKPCLIYASGSYTSEMLVPTEGEGYSMTGRR